MRNFKKSFTILGVIASLILGSTSAIADSYDPLRTTVGYNNDNILEYVVEDGAVEINSYLAIMPPAVTW